MNNLIKNIKKEHIILAAIIIITIIAFYPTFENGFTNWDDDYYVTKNFDIKKQWNEKIGIFFSEYCMGNYHPFTMASLAIDYQIDGLNPLTFHITNLILHLINTLLVFWFILLLLKSVNYKRSLEIALITSALFGVHTLHVESVAWISERKDVLYTMFFLLSLIAYLKYVNIKKNKFLIISIVLFLFSLLSKGQAVSLAVTLIAIDYFLGRKLLSKKVIFEKIPFFALSIIFGVIAIFAQQDFNSIQTNTHFSFFDRILFSCYGFIQYISKLIAPTNLSAYYSYPEKINDSLPLEFWLYLLAVIGIVLLFIYLIKKRKKDIVFGILFFIINIFLVLQLMPVGGTIMADRYSYLPSIGFFLLIGIGIKWVLETQKRSIIVFVKTISVLYLILLVFLTINRTKVWNNSMTLWNDVIEKGDGVALAYGSRGSAKQALNDLDGAMKDYNKAIEINPKSHRAYNHRGVVKSTLKDFEGAILDYSKAIESKPKFGLAFFNRGTAKNALKDYKGALKDYNKAIEINPKNYDAYNNRGILKYELKDFERAMLDYNKAIELNPENILAYNNKGNLEKDLGNINAAIDNYSKAIEISPDYYLSYIVRAKAYVILGENEKAKQDIEKVKQLGGKVDEGFLNTQNQTNTDNSLYNILDEAERQISAGNTSKAMELYDKAIEHDKQFADAYFARGSLKGQRMGDLQGALADINKAIEIKPNDKIYYLNRGIVHLLLNNYSQTLEDYNKTIELDNNFCMAYNNRAALFLNMNQLNKAKQDITKAQSLGCQVNPNLLKLVGK